jgi:glycosyltransferase involved in cell wall biosynthesis
MKLCIGMPVYNGKNTIRASIKSILSQEFSDFELVISDNGSTDGTLQAIDAAVSGDSRVRILRQQHNLGAAGNFECVLRESKSTFFMWAACDDLWSPDYLSHSLAMLEEDMQVGFVMPSFKLHSRRLKISKCMDLTLFDFVTSGDRGARVLSFANLHPMSHKCNLVYSLFRREVIEHALDQQDISDDGMLSLVLLASARGSVLSGYRFRKCYPWLWPGAMSGVARLLGRGPDELDSRQSIKDHYQRASEHLPEYQKEMQMIMETMAPDSYGRRYNVVDPSELGFNT